MRLSQSPPMWLLGALALSWGGLGVFALLAALGVPLGSLGTWILILPGGLVRSCLEWFGGSPEARTFLTDSAHSPPFLNLRGVFVVFAIPAGVALLVSFFRGRVSGDTGACHHDC